MKGGIQPGTTAWDSQSLKHDKLVRQAAEMAYEILKDKHPDLTKHRKLPKEYIFDGIGACQPDGGVWFFGGRLIAAFEAKKQGPRGNAIERWYKNYFLLKEVNPRCPLVTYAIGEGVRSGSPIERILYAAHRGKYNVFCDAGPSCFLKEDGFSLEELYTNMVKFIEQEIKEAP
jgi:hypothetical protein